MFLAHVSVIPKEVGGGGGGGGGEVCDMFLSDILTHF